MTNTAKARVGVHHLSRRSLQPLALPPIRARRTKTYLGVVKALEKMRNPDKANIVIPHHDPLLVLARDLERILENCDQSAASPL